MVFTAEQTAVAHAAMKFLAARCDHAQSRDGSAFSKIDAIIGKSLAAAGTLSLKQSSVLVAWKIAQKYRKTQLPAYSARVLESKVDQNSPAVVL